MRPKRRIYVVDTTTQGQYIRHGLMVLVVGLLLGACNVYVLLSLLDGFREGVTIVGSDWLSASLLLGHALIALGVNLGIVIILCLLYSHRLAGAARKIGVALEQMADGGLGRHLALRDEDYLHNLAARVNALSDTWKESLSRIDASVDALRECTFADPSAQSALDAIEAEIDHYRIRKPTEASEGGAATDTGDAIALYPRSGIGPADARAGPAATSTSATSENPPATA